MNDPFSVDEDHVHVDNLSRADVAADVALFLEGEQEIDGLIVATATADGDELVLVVEDAHDRSRTFRLRVVGG